MGRLTRAGTIEHSPDIACGGLAAALAYRAELMRFLGARGVSSRRVPGGRVIEPVSRASR